MQRKKLFLIGFALFLFSLTSANAQVYMGYMVTKTLLDSVKVNKLHGTAGLALKVEQTDNLKFELDVTAELIYALDKHKFRFTGNVAYNFLNDIDTGNKGYFHIQGDFFQYRINDTHREKSPFFFSAFGTYQYDYLRALHNRAAIGTNFTFQPLREHPNLCLEPGVGIVGSYQNWDVLSGDKLTLYNALPEGSKEYLDIKDNGRFNQWDFRIAAFLHFFGDWDHIAFSLYTTVLQPVKPAFKALSTEEALLPQEFKGLLNTKALPLVGAGGYFQVKIWKKLSAVTRFDLIWDGGQAPVESCNLTYCLTQGLAYQW